MFTEKASLLFKDLGEDKIMVLATSENDVITARSMSFIIYNYKFYFQTDLTMKKAEQIAANSRVAICYQNYQIEGICREIGRPLDEENNFFAELYRKHYGGSYRKYSHKANERVYEVFPTKITVWDYEDGNPYRDCFDFRNKIYKREVYNIG